ncbi:radical SAM/SPASM domain-containing protein [Sedimentisphaera salicampi]|uniref:Antilisterial bacteriocin subtilosin biosynthesis protein AlbA n=1 Tax=Sedimentisphaera salicampi TaxID=1941349 RepID=A0A1W6LMA4_9BACT|nr:radical SAM protein [Sedimentisphaera salicampi]ARN56905.1 Antilisterial bacteriocin subtilosin biosynthesis protein AlbA [Sedimentisphaera salicampi]
MDLKTASRFAYHFFRCLGRLPAKHLLYLARKMGSENPHMHSGKLWINTFFPPIPSPAFDRFMDSVLARARTPYSAYFAVTSRCPHSCAHCSFAGRQAGELPTADALEIISQIDSLGCPVIGFTGGEPLLRKDLPELIEAASKNASTVLFTTASGLTEPIARKLKDAGLSSVMVGIESAEMAEHNRLRGRENSFRQAFEGIKIAKQAGLYAAASTIAFREKIRSCEIEKIARFCESLGAMELRILEPIPTGGVCGDDSIILSSEESREMADFQKRWNRRKTSLAVCSFSHLESGEMFGCGAGYHHLFIDSAGNVCPCDLTPLSFGNALEKPLSEIWQEMEQFFPLPRRGCFMKEAAKKGILPAAGSALPAGPETSRNICRQLPRRGRLPKVYENYLNR